MMSVTAIIQGAQAQHWGRMASLGPPHVPLGTYGKLIRLYTNHNCKLSKCQRL